MFGTPYFIVKCLVVPVNVSVIFKTQNKADNRLLMRIEKNLEKTLCTIKCINKGSASPLHKNYKILLNEIKDMNKWKDSS